jgi:Protein of unknown function (DUF2892)
LLYCILPIPSAGRLHWFSGTISGTTALVLVIFAIIFAITSLVSFCPLYLPFGISTSKKKE